MAFIYANVGGLIIIVTFIRTGDRLVVKIYSKKITCKRVFYIPNGK
jgi:hypothetical protein